MKSALRIRVIVGYQSIGLKPALRYVPVVLGLASPLLLPVALGQFDLIDVLLHTTKISKLEQPGDPIVLK